MSEQKLVERLFMNPRIVERVSQVAAARFLSGRYAPLVHQAVRSVQHAKTMGDALYALHQIQRLDEIFKMNVQDDDAVFEAATNEAAYPLWNRFGSFDVAAQYQEMIAELLVKGDPEQRYPALLILSDNARGVDDKILHQLVAKGGDVDVLFFDDVFQRRMLHAMDAEKAKKYGTNTGQYYLQASRRVIARGGNPSVPFSDTLPLTDVQTAYNKQWQGMRNTYVPTQHFTLTEFPTREDAERDGVDYETLQDGFVQMMLVDQAQQDGNNRCYKRKLDAAEDVHITNSDGTNIRFSIKGMTFANSLMARNMPGSELFSAPVLDSVNGRIVAKGKFMPLEADQIIEDITLDIVDGVIVHYDAAKGREFLAQVIETDEGSHRIGEIGFGTNPAYRRHTVNGLLVEKIGGSFHMAIGWSYQDKEYMGEKVNLDNGNRSAVHWDITVMLHDKDGMIALDGVPIMKHGRYLDPELQFLNGDDYAPRSASQRLTP